MGNETARPRRVVTSQLDTQALTGMILCVAVRDTGASGAVQVGHQPGGPLQLDQWHHDGRQRHADEQHDRLGPADQQGHARAGASRYP